MRRLLLTSSGFGNDKIRNTFLKLAKKPVSEIKVLFIPTASRKNEEMEYVKKSKKELTDLGLLEENIRVFNLGEEIDDKDLSKVDAIYVCGGNTYYLLKRLKETRFDATIKMLVESGKIYVGVSAGSIVAGPEINIASMGDENDCNLEDLQGLYLTSLVVIPHYQNKDKEEIEKIKQDYLFDIVALNDGEALLILNLSVEKIK
jgi:peptidase E